MSIVWHDGEFLKAEDFKISPSDRGLCHGLSLFETMLGVDGSVRLLKEHLHRLNDGLGRLGVRNAPLSANKIDSAISSLLVKNGLQTGYSRIRLTVSLGGGALNKLDCGAAWAWMTADGVTHTGGSVKVVEAPWRRDILSVLRGMKVGNYAEHLIAADLARREGFDEMLFYNTSGDLCEAAMANVFLIRGKSLLTPSLDSGCLPGVTRREIIDISNALNIQCVEKPLTSNDVSRADGLFLTSSIKGPVWVTMFGERHFSRSNLFEQIREQWENTVSLGKRA